MNSLLIPLLIGACTMDSNYSRVKDEPQGGFDTAAEYATEDFHQADEENITAIDVLFVVDSSGSMASKQTSLTDNFPIFMNYFMGLGIDYHIGVITTDMSSATEQGRLHSYDGKKYIDASTSDPITAFTALATVGIGGSSAEMGRDPIYNALYVYNNSDNAGFLRPDSGLIVIVITDENDSSTSQSISGFVNQIENEQMSRGVATINSIVDVGTGCGTLGSDYLTVSRQVGGDTFDICEGDWSAILHNLAASTTLRDEFYLSGFPLYEDEISVTVTPLTGNVLNYYSGDGAFSYNSVDNSIVFNSGYTPAAGSTVSAYFQIY